MARASSRALVALLAVAAIIVASVPVTSAPAQASPRSAEREIVDLVNAEREQRGLAAVRVNTDLRAVARAWSEQMASCARSNDRRSCLAHNPQYGSQVTRKVSGDWTRIGENVGYTILSGAPTSQLARRVHSNLMDSAGHRANILGDYNQVGIGVAIARDGSMWVTQNFMEAPLTDSVEPGPEGSIPVDVSDAAVPIVGDWNGDGRVTAGWYDAGRVFLRFEHGDGDAHASFSYGRSGDVPIVGDWNGDGRDTIGILRGGRWHLRNTNSGGDADLSFSYGRLNSGDYALAGDWNGDGQDTVGIVREGEWHLRDVNRGGAADRVFRYGRVRTGDVPVVGDWNGDGSDTPGIIRGNEWHLRYLNRGGIADNVFKYGNGIDTPLAGDWNGRGTTTPGIVRDGEWHLRNANSGGGAHEQYGF